MAITAAGLSDCHRLHVHVLRELKALNPAIYTKIPVPHDIDLIPIGQACLLVGMKRKTIRNAISKYRERFVKPWAYIRGRKGPERCLYPQDIEVLRAIFGIYVKR